MGFQVCINFLKKARARVFGGYFKPLRPSSDYPDYLLLRRISGPIFIRERKRMVGEARVIDFPGAAAAPLSLRAEV